MPLTLTLRNADRLDNGSPTSLVLDKRGAIVGRAATVDWCLPDPTRELSSRHCEIQFRDGVYVLTDISTNGTFLLGSAGRLPAPRTIAAGDVFIIGPFEIVAALDDATAAAMAARNAAPPPPDWKGWGLSSGADAASPAPAASGWDAVPATSAISGAGPMSGNWAAPSAAPAASSGAASGGWGAAPPSSPPAPAAATGWGAPSPASAPQPPAAGGWGAPPAPAEPASGGGWGASAPSPAASFAAPTAASTWQTPAAPPPPASDWSTPVAPPPPPSAADVWGQVAASNVVDWARGGFGAPTPPPAFDPAPAPAFAPLPSASAPPVPAEQTTMTAAPGAPVGAAAAAPPPPSAPTAASSGSIEHLLAATGLAPSALKQEPAAALHQAGDVLRRLVAGFVVMLEARARAKSQLGAAGTSLEFDGNNPLKFARTPEQALAQLLNPAERGFMPADRAIEDAFRDLQAHQVATLKAMQGALRATLDRFSPTAIRGRADQKGLIAKIMPGARDAALWQTYEREFGGVAQGSDEAFMDVFAKEFRKAYDETVRGG